MKLRNFTPHPVNFNNSLLPSEGVARVSVKEEQCWDNPLFLREEFGKVEGLPPYEEGTVLIVSSLAKLAAKAEGRTDCVSPARLTRDEQGRITGCSAFSV